MMPFMGLGSQLTNVQGFSHLQVICVHGYWFRIGEQLFV